MNDLKQAGLFLAVFAAVLALMAGFAWLLVHL
jgi:hypothetical protein